MCHTAIPILSGYRKRRTHARVLSQTLTMATARKTILIVEVECILVVISMITKRNYTIPHLFSALANATMILRALSTPPAGTSVTVRVKMPLLGMGRPWLGSLSVPYRTKASATQIMSVLNMNICWETDRKQYETNCYCSF